MAIHKRASKNPAKLLTGVRKLRSIRQFYIFQGLGVPFNIASYSLLTCMYIYIFQGLGIPFNIASYSLLIYMIAHVTGLQVKPLY